MFLIINLSSDNADFKLSKLKEKIFRGQLRIMHKRSEVNVNTDTFKEKEYILILDEYHDFL